MDKQKPIKVLFLAGNGRSGSTILHNILGQPEGFVAVGELRYVWERGFINNWLCGCGDPFRECSFWNEVVTEAFGGWDKIDAETMFRQTESFRMKHLPTTIFSANRNGHRQRLQDYLTNIHAFYKAIAKVAGAKVIVDSSKNPSYGYLLRELPDTALYVVHFIRDPRAAAHSWTRKKLFLPATDDKPAEYMPRRPIYRSALQWNARNFFTETSMLPGAQNSLRMRYEDFVSNPKEAVERILTMVDESVDDLPFTDNHTVHLQPNHSVFGNVVRFSTDAVTIKQDEEWAKVMTQGEKSLVSAITLPLMLRYGYGFGK